MALSCTSSGKDVEKPLTYISTVFHPSGSCDRDFFMTPEEAVDYGIIDEVVQTKTSNIEKPPMPTL